MEFLCSTCFLFLVLCFLFCVSCFEFLILSFLFWVSCFLFLILCFVFCVSPSSGPAARRAADLSARSSSVCVCLLLSLNTSGKRRWWSPSRSPGLSLSSAARHLFIKKQQIRINMEDNPFHLHCKSDTEGQSVSHC